VTAVPWRQRLLHVGVLCALAVAQPLFDVLGRDATFFVAHHVRPGDVLLFVTALVLVPPALVVGLEAVAGLAGVRVRALAQQAVTAGLVGLVVLPPLNRIAGPRAVLAFAVAGLAGVAAALAYARWRPARTFLTVLSPAALVFPAVFLLHGPVRRLVIQGAVGGAGVAHVGRPAPVVMVLFDGLPLNSLLDERDGIDAVRYPSFARLAGESTWFRGATSVSQDTATAVPAILTGCYPPDEHRLPTAAEHPRNLFTLLGGSFELHVHESLTELCPASLCQHGGRPAAQEPASRRAVFLDAAVVYAHLVLPGELRRRLPSIEDRWNDFAAPVEKPRRTAGVFGRAVAAARGDRAGGFARFLEGIEPSPRPTLHFLHVVLPHSPWTYFPSGRRLSGRSPEFAGMVQGRWADEVAARQAELRHLLQVGFVDTLVGRLLERLQATGLYDSALVVITADHGASFLPREPYRLATDATVADIARVPIFVKAPGQHEGRVDDGNVETIDILPTIAAHLGIELPWPVDGVAVPAAVPRPGKKLVRRVQDALSLPTPLAAGPGLAARLARFGAGTPWETLFVTGPYSGLVGRRLEAERDAVVDGYVLHPLRAWTEKVDARSPTIPALVEGRLDATGALAAAVAVNGAIAAVVPEWSADGARGYSTLLPETVFRAGSNDLAILAVRRAP
jgi:hypothetical protein